MDKGEKAQQIIGTILGLILIPVLIGWGMKASERKAEKYPWSVSFFMGENLTDSKKNEFKTLEECREWAQKKADRQNLEEGKWDYECGLGCEYVDQSVSGGRQVQTYECSDIKK